MSEHLSFLEEVTSGLGGGFQTEFHQPYEQQRALVGAAAVEAKLKLRQKPRQPTHRDRALQRSQNHALEQARHAMHPWQLLARLLRVADHFGFVCDLVFLDCCVAVKAIGVRRRALLHIAWHNRCQRLALGVVHGFQPQPAAFSAPVLDHHHHVALLFGQAAAHALIVAAAHDGLVDLDAANQAVLLAAVQHVGEFQLPQPRRFVVHANLALELFAVGAVLLGHEQVEQQEQLVEFQLRAVQDRACRGAGLMAALGALDDRILAKLVTLAMAAARAGKTAGPAGFDQHFAAGIVGAVELHELNQVGRHRQKQRGLASHGPSHISGRRRERRSLRLAFHRSLPKDPLRLQCTATRPDVGGHPSAALKKKTDDAGDVGINVGGVKVTLQNMSRQQMQVVSELQSQMEKLKEAVQVLSPSQKAVELKEVEAPPVPVPTQAERRILWVDDEPQNNILLAEFLRDQGVDVDTALSTAEALRQVSRRTYAAVVTDLGRQENGSYSDDAGVELVEEIRKRSITVPIYVYTSKDGIKRARVQAEKAGAELVTSNSSILMSYLKQLLNIP